MNQKEAVFSAVVGVTGHKGEGAVVISSEQRKQVNQILVEGFKSGKITLEKKFNDKDLMSYASSLQSNWIRKDTRLNGGDKYQAKNPGSRAGSTDSQLKNLKALQSTVTTDEEREEIQEYIDKRTEEIAATKQAKAVDFSALPPELQAKFGHATK